MTSHDPVTTVALTTGEPSGIGPDLCGFLPDRRWPCRIVLIGDRSLFGRVEGSQQEGGSRKMRTGWIPIVVEAKK